MVTTYYLYDEEDIVAEYDASGALIASYIHGPGIDEPVQMTRGGATYYYTFDGLGSVRDLTDPTETLIEQYDYDAFGNLTAPPATGNPYTYTSREYDPETGLLFYRARYYDPAVGRFITEDPIGFDGDVNFYAYVAGNPINVTDPYGEEPHTTGKTIQCGKGCWIRIDINHHDGGRHMHWGCNGKEGVMGEFGGTSHGGTWEDAPERILDCAKKNGFQPEPLNNPPSNNHCNLLPVPVFPSPITNPSVAPPILPRIAPPINY